MRKLQTFCVVCLILAASASCKRKPVFYPELTSYSEPVDGMLPYFQGTKMDPFWPKTNEGHELPDDLRRMNDSTLRSDSGRSANALALVRGKYSFVTFFYTSCSGICPLIKENIKSLSSQIEDQSDLQFLSITIDPTIDDENALRGFRAKHLVSQSNWTFLTVDKKQIENLAREQFAGEIEANTGKNGLIAFVHTENIFLLDKDGYLRGMYRARGNGEFPRIMQELQTLRKEHHL